MARIVVGVDGSEDSKAALAWAVDEASTRGCDVHVIHSWSLPAMSIPLSALDKIPQIDIEHAGEHILDDVIGSIADTKGVTITREVANELPAQALIRASEDADLVVVGSRGLGGFKGLLLGSVAQHVVHHARCPVVIIPHRQR